MELFVFYVFAAVAVAAALMVVLQRRAVYSALALIVCFGAMAILFFQLGAQFVAAIQIIVYAGAIMALFLFVIMLLDPESEVFAPNRLQKTTLLAAPAAAFLAFLLLQVLRDPFASSDSTPPLQGAAEVIAPLLFRDYLLPFEATSILILTAILGALVLAKRPE